MIKTIVKGGALLGAALSLYAGSAAITHVQASQAVQLQTAFQTTYNPMNGQSNTLHPIVQNMTGSQQMIYMALSLSDSSGRVIKSTSYDNITLNPYNINNYNATTLSSPTNLSPGTYYWNISLYNPGKSGLIASYNKALSFVVPGTISSGNGGSTQGDVTVQSTSVGEFHLNNCPPLTVLLSNSGSQARSVLVDVELRNSSGQLISQTVTDNYTVNPTPSGGLQALNASCKATQLANDTYTYSVGLFNPGWSGVIHWYPNVQQFTTSSQSTSSSPTIQVVMIDRPKSNPAAGSSFNVTPTLISTNQTTTNATVIVFLSNQNNQKPYTVTYSNQTFTANAQMNFPLSVTSAQAGTYTIGVTIQDQNGSVVFQNTNLGTIVVQ